MAISVPSVLNYNGVKTAPNDKAGAMIFTSPAEALNTTQTAFSVVAVLFLTQTPPHPLSTAVQTSANDPLSTIIVEFATAIVSVLKRIGSIAEIEMYQF